MSHVAIINVSIIEVSIRIVGNPHRWQLRRETHRLLCSLMKSADINLTDFMNITLNNLLTTMAAF